MPFGDQTFLTAAPDDAPARPHERARGRDEGSRLLPDGSGLLLQAPIGPQSPERQRDQDGPEAPGNIERGPFERVAGVVDADADEKGEADREAERDPGRPER